MIARLVEAAIAEGLELHPSWSRQKGLVLDAESGAVSEGEFLTILPQRSGTRAFETPGYLCEKGTNLQPGNPFRDSMAALAARWAAETGHPLPVAVADFLRAGRALPDDPRWVAFGLGGKTCADFPELHPLVYAECAPATAGQPEPCAGCGLTRPPVELHDGVIAMGNAAPVLVSWNRGGIVNRGARRNGANLPTCRDCMYLYVAWLNKHVEYHRESGHHAFLLDGQRWFLSSNVRAGFVCDLARESPTAGLWAAAASHQQAKMEKRMSQDRAARWAEKLAAIDRVFAETNDQNYLLGYMYGVLEWATWVLRLPCTSANVWTKAGTGTIGGTLGATDNYATCADGTGGSTAQPCTDQALFPGGASEAAPGIAFQNDPNTGLVAPGSDVLVVVNGGASRLLFDNSTMQVKNTVLATFRGIQISGSIDPVLAISGSVASPLVLHDGYSQYLLTNEGATSMRAVTLPDAVAGYTLKFCNQDSDGIRINANAGDTIRRVASVTSSGGYIETTTIGACITIKSLNATENYVVDSNDLATDSWSFN
jgi:hypothetical protein